MNRLLEVEASLATAHSLKPDYSDATLALLALYIRLQRHSDAFALLEKYLETIPDPGLVQLPATYLYRIFRPESGVLHAFYNENPLPEVSESDIRTWIDRIYYAAININPVALPFSNYQANMIREDWYRQLMVQHYTRMVREGIDLPEIYFRLARELQRSHHPREAIVYFKKCLDRNHFFMPAKISLAFAYEEAGDIPASIATFRSLLEDFSHFSEDALKGGEGLLSVDGFIGKDDLLQTELRLLMVQGDRSERMADFSYNIGRIYFLLEDPDKALKYFDHALGINPDYIQATFAKSMALMQLNRFDTASEILNRLTRQGPLYFKVVYHLGRLLLLSGDRTSAIPLLETLLKDENTFQDAARKLLHSLS